MDPTITIFNMASRETACSLRGSATKYSCIHCNEPICNRTECSVPEMNDEIEGWVVNKSVAYCRDCSFRPGEKTVTGDDEFMYADEVDEEDLGDNDPYKHGPKEKKNSGRKSMWSVEHLDDMIFIVTGNENFKRKLIFTNNK